MPSIHTAVEFNLHRIRQARRRRYAVNLKRLDCFRALFFSPFFAPKLPNPTSHHQRISPAVATVRCLSK